MDVARFAESHGYEQDYDRPFAYHYRDFLIQAFNQDMPYDQFVRWQLAGDELAPDDPLALAATGFLGAGAFPTQMTEAEFESARYDELDDMTATTGVGLPRPLGRLRPLPRPQVRPDPRRRLLPAGGRPSRRPSAARSTLAAGAGAQAGQGAGHQPRASRTPSTTPTTAASRTSTRRPTSCSRGDVTQKQGEADARLPPRPDARRQGRRVLAGRAARRAGPAPASAARRWRAG